MKIKFINGPNQGKQFKVQTGVILSRKKLKKEDISILDPKASSPHAEIIKKRKYFYLKDLNSKNGTYVNEDINDLFALKPGLKFFIGETGFQVMDTPPEPKKKKSVKKTWQDTIIEELEKYSERIKDPQAEEMLPIYPTLQLSFKSGPQKGDVWHVYYGPRQSGSASVDLPILEPSAPGICFSLHPISEGGVLFKTTFPDKVFLNKKHQSKKNLEAGDIISIVNTLIEVSFSKK